VAHFDTANDNGGRTPDERRREPRHRVLLTGKLVYPRINHSADCTIRDLSPSGARLRVRPEDLSSDPFLIVVKQAIVHGAITAWRSGAQAGLFFVDSVCLVGQAPPHLRESQRIWMDLRRAERALDSTMPCGPRRPM
jgi:hypothetical protein